MERRVGTISRGIRCPIIREGDNLADIIVENVLEAAKSEGCLSLIHICKISYYIPPQVIVVFIE